MIFYDLETSGTTPALDRPVQFAAICVNGRLDVTEETAFCIRLPEGVAMNPEAQAVHGLDGSDGEHEYTAAMRIFRLVNSGRNGGYNTLAFDDQFLRFMFWRNLMPAYNHQWKDGASRFDVYPLAAMARLIAPKVLTHWPTNDMGLPSLRLEHLSEANKLAEGKAHDALVDVLATLELYRRLVRDNGMRRVINVAFHKYKDASQVSSMKKLNGLPLGFLVDGRYAKYGLRVQAVRLGAFGKQEVWLNLSSQNLQQGSSDEVHNMIWRRQGETPMIFPEFAGDPPAHASDDVARQNIDFLQNHPNYLKLLVAQAQERLRTPPSWVDRADPEARLYLEEFPSDELLNGWRGFHRADVVGKVGWANDLPYPYFLLAQRILVRNGFQHPQIETWRNDVLESRRTAVDHLGNTPYYPLGDEIAAEEEMELVA